MRDTLQGELAKRAELNNPLRVGVIGEGKFATMFFSQARLLSGLHVLGIVDLDRERAVQALKRVQWPIEQFAAKDFKEAFENGSSLSLIHI